MSSRVLASLTQPARYRTPHRSDAGWGHQGPEHERVDAPSARIAAGGHVIPPQAVHVFRRSRSPAAGGPRPRPQAVHLHLCLSLFAPRSEVQIARAIPRVDNATGPSSPDQLVLGSSPTSIERPLSTRWVWIVSSGTPSFASVERRAAA